MRPIPNELHGTAFTTGEAAEFGITPTMLRGRRFVQLFHGVYRTRDSIETFELTVRAALKILPPDSAVSHLTALRLYGLAIGAGRSLHFSTNVCSPTRVDGVVLHRRQDTLQPVKHNGIPLLDPIRTFVDVAAVIDDRRLTWVGDWMLAEGLVDLWDLRLFVLESHLNGVQRARRVVEFIRPGSASVKESDVRWHLRKAGLPEPELNVDIVTDDGRWLARGDLVYRERKVLVEYDGWQHERDARQRQWDLHRREALEADGWRVVVITVADLEKPHTVVARVRQALRQQGQAA